MTYTPTWHRLREAIVAELAHLVAPGFTADTDPTLAANSDTRVATQKAVKTYVAAVGAVGAPVKIVASLAATWILANPLGRVPLVQVFLTDGEQILTDVVADAAFITVSFASPQQGFVLAY